MSVLKHFGGAEASRCFQKGFQLFQRLICGDLFFCKAVGIQADQYCPFLRMLFKIQFHKKPP